MEEEMESQVEEDFSQEESYEEPAAVEETSVAVEEQVSEPEGKESWDFSDCCIYIYMCFCIGFHRVSCIPKIFV